MLNTKNQKNNCENWCYFTKLEIVPPKFKEKIFGSVNKKYGFAKVVKVKKSNKKHTAHLLRLSTERQLANKPSMILSSEQYKFETAIEKIKNMHKQIGKQKIAYLEIHCAFESLNLLTSYVKELSQKFNSEVFAVIHEDESVPHCHILISWNNKEGKAIRLSKGDFKKLWKTTIQKLQPSRQLSKQKGEGLPSVPYWQYRQAWLKGQKEYEKFCETQWKKWYLFYQWLEENNWNVKPPLRRKLFQDWLLKKGYIEISVSLTNKKTLKPLMLWLPEQIQQIKPKEKHKIFLSKKIVRKKIKAHQLKIF